MRYMLRGPFWDGFRTGCRYVVPFALVFAVFALAMAKTWFEFLVAGSSLIAATYANVLVFTRR